MVATRGQGRKRSAEEDQGKPQRVLLFVQVVLQFCWCSGLGAQYMRYNATTQYNATTL